MKRILCFGDSNTWGYDAVTDGRFPEDIRWTGVLQNSLGNEYKVLEEGLPGRTTVFDDPLTDGVNGLKYLYPCLTSHSLLDYLVIMLGTNDCKERFNATPRNIADGLKRLVQLAKSMPVWTSEAQILIIAPGPIEARAEDENAMFAGEMGVSSAKSYLLSAEFKRLAEEEGCHFLDAGEFASMNKLDYMHLDENSHKELGEAVAAEIRKFSK